MRWPPAARRMPLRVSGTELNLGLRPPVRTSTGVPVFYASPPPRSPSAAPAATTTSGSGSPTTARRRENPGDRRGAARTSPRRPERPDRLRCPTPGPRLLARAVPGSNKLMALLYIITILAFVSSLFLISATMNTLIAEQAGEIAILKTLGGRRRQIGGIALRTATMLGAGRRGRRHHPGHRHRLPADPLLRPDSSSTCRSASPSRPRSSWPAWCSARRSRRPRRCPPCGARCAGPWPKPWPSTATQRLRLRPARPRWSRAAACWPGPRYPAACGWACATYCGNSAAARRRSRRSPWPPGLRSRSSPSASR